MTELRFKGVHFFARDMARTTDFYKRLGFALSGDKNFARATLPDGKTFEFGSYDLTRAYDPAFREPSGTPANALQFAVESREAVDDLFAEMTGAGYKDRLAPFDAFWGSRYMEVYDPDGNIVGVQSPRDESKVSRPPV